MRRALASFSAGSPLYRGNGLCRMCWTIAEQGSTPAADRTDLLRRRKRRPHCRRRAARSTLETHLEGWCGRSSLVGTISAAWDESLQARAVYGHLPEATERSADTGI